MQYDGLIAVSKYAVFGVPLDRAIQHEAFQLATDDRQLAWMRHLNLLAFSICFSGSCDCARRPRWMVCATMLALDSAARPGLAGTARDRYRYNGEAP